jgi:hypothetical protein
MALTGKGNNSQGWHAITTLEHWVGMTPREHADPASAVGRHTTPIPFYFASVARPGRLPGGSGFQPGQIG